MTRAKLPVVFTPTAQRHVETAQAWWRKNRPAAPDALLDELRSGLELIGLQPARGTPLPDTRLSGVRRVLLRRVRYFLYYRVAPDGQRLEVLALWHSRRGSEPDV